MEAPFELLAAWIEAQVAYRGWPGLSIAVVHDQVIAWSRGFGLADRERRIPATPATRYRVASITKTFTATAIMQLRDAGKLRLDDEVRSHLPWFAPPSRHADAAPITIRHLLTHTAGLPRESAFPYWTDGSFPGLDEVRAALRTQDCVLPTETRWKYSNLALVVAGEIVATVSGRPWAEYLRTSVLEPLGMRDTLVETPALDDARLARPYARRLPGGERVAAPDSDVRGISAAAGLTTTVEDLARFAMLQFRGGPAGGSQVLRGSTLREMQRIHWLEPDWQAGWGLGFHISRAKDRTLVGHGGALRGYRSELRFSPAERLAVIVLINADDGEPRTVVDKAFEWIAPALAPISPPAVADPSWQRYAGRYRNGWGDTHVLVVDGRLTMVGINLPDPMLSPATLVPVGEHTFRIDTKDGYGSHGELVVFELDAAGRVTRVKVGANYTLPVDAW
jgi:CubicO group peptidase (beta-lactamase class C family)